MLRRGQVFVAVGAVALVLAAVASAETRITHSSVTWPGSGRAASLQVTVPVGPERARDSIYVSVDGVRLSSWGYTGITCSMIPTRASAAGFNVLWLANQAVVTISVYQAKRAASCRGGLRRGDVSTITIWSVAT
ncbi:MAG TPA: hypothetical protein VGF23_00585 [Gaiellaceae bacterium]|jgi:hypothetical protein